MPACFDAAPLILHPFSGMSLSPDCRGGGGLLCGASSCSTRRFDGTEGGVDFVNPLLEPILLRSDNPLPPCGVPLRGGEVERTKSRLLELVLAALSDCVLARAWVWSCRCCC